MCRCVFSLQAGVSEETVLKLNNEILEMLTSVRALYLVHALEARSLGPSVAHCPIAAYEVE